MGDEERLSEQLIVERIQAGVYLLCNCGAVLEKDGGCNYIQCPICKTGWCWVLRLPKGKGAGHCSGGHNCH